MHEESDDLTGQEREALESLGGEMPPAGLEDRVVEALATRGLLRHSGSATVTWRTRLPRVAAAVVAASILIAIGAGGALWWTSAPAPATAESAFVLLLMSGPEELAVTDAEEARRVDEYSSWAGEIAGQGRFVAGEKLASDARLLSPRPNANTTTMADEPVAAADRSGAVLAGYFIVRADTYDDAVEIARGCPHLRYGGQIEVRRIVPT